MLSSYPDASAGKESTCSVGDMGSNPGLGKYLGEGNGYLLHYSGLENSMESDTTERLSLSLFTFTHTNFISIFFFWNGLCSAFTKAFSLNFIKKKKKTTLLSFLTYISSVYKIFNSIKQLE